MKQVSEQTIESLLKEEGLKAHIEEPSNQIASSLKIDSRDFPLFCRILSEGDLLQVIAFIPVSVEAKGMIDLARFLHMVNKELDMPGFCVDEQSGTVFYRVVIPTLGKKIDPNLFKAYIKTIQNVCHTFGTIVLALAAGAMTMDEIMAISQKNKNDQIKK